MPKLNVISKRNSDEIWIETAKSSRFAKQSRLSVFAQSFGRILYISALIAGLIAIRFAFMSSYV